MESTVVEVGISAADNMDISQNQTQNIVEALHGAVSAALRQNGHPNVTVVQLPPVFGSSGSGVVSFQGVNQGANSNSTNDPDTITITATNETSNEEAEQQNSTTSADTNSTEETTENQPETTVIINNSNTSTQERRQEETSSNNSNTNSPTR